MVRAGLMSERDYDKRRCTRDVARKIRHRDDPLAEGRQGGTLGRGHKGPKGRRQLRAGR